MKYNQLLMKDLYKKLCENVKEFCLPLSLFLSLSLVHFSSATHVIGRGTALTLDAFNSIAHVGRLAS